MEYRVMRIDPRSITAETLTFADGTLTINVPQRTFNSGCPYFLRIVDDIPAETTIGADVVITIGDGTVEYPLVGFRGAQLTAEYLRSGYSYPIALVNSGANGAFRMLAPVCYNRLSGAFSVDGTAPAAAGGGAAG